MEVEVIVSDTETTGQKGLFDVGGLTSKVAQKGVSEVSGTFRDSVVRSLKT